MYRCDVGNENIIVVGLEVCALLFCGEDMPDVVRDGRQGSVEAKIQLLL